MNRTVRCKTCGERVVRDDAIRVGLSWACVRCARSGPPRAVPGPPAWTWQRKRPVAIPTKVRQAVAARDGGRCRMCGARTHLHVHHVRYRSEGGPHAEANLITLCMGDHDLVHSSKRHWQPILLEVLDQHYGHGHRITVYEAERLLSTRDASS